MVTQTALTYPSAYNDQGGGNWNWGGGSPLALLQDGIDGTGLLGHGNSTDQYLSGQYFEVSHIFSGLPAGAQVMRIGAMFRHAEYNQNPSKSTRYRYGSTQAWNVIGLPLTRTWSAVNWQAVTNQLVDGTGNYNAVVQLGLPSDMFANQNIWTVDELQLQIEYNTLPAAPIQTAPIGNVGTLVPTFTGNHVDADGDAMSQVELEVRRVSDNALMWSAVIVDTGTDFSQGYAGTGLVANVAYKWRARTKDSVAGSNFGTWSDFVVFTPITNTIPVAGIVTPTGGASVGSLTPQLQFSYFDADGDAQSGYQVQVRRVSNQVSMWDTGQVGGATTTITYAGTGLTSTIAYEWRARVQDSKGAWSDYTAWASFTPSAIPNPPTILTPTGLQNTLTPSITGVYNQAGGGAQAAFQYEIRQGAVVIYASGDVATVIATGQAYGTNNPSDIPAAPPALAWGVNYEIRARSKDNAANYSSWTGWQAFSTNAAPTSPTGLTPNGGVTGDTTPALSWVHNDVNLDAQTEANVELRKVSDDSVVTGYGPKNLVQATLTHNVTEVLIASPATAYKFRVQTKATSGPGFGPWSDWVTFTVATAPSVTVTNPVPAQVIAAPALNVTWTMTGGSGVQSTYRIRVYASDQTTIVYDSTALAGANLSFILPVGVLRNLNTYYLDVTLVDTLAQSTSSGKILITTSWTPPATIAGFQVTPIGDQ